MENEQRISQEGFHVSLEDKAYEVLFTYINPEVTEAVPHETIVKNIPIGYKFWDSYYQCRKECNIKNEKMQTERKKCYLG